MTAGAVAFFFDFGDPVEFVGIRFDVIVGVVEPGDGVQAGAFGLALGDDGVGHADDGGRVHAATEFGEDGTVGAESALDGLRKDAAEVLFVFSVGSVADSLTRIEIPILADIVLYTVLGGPQQRGRRRWDGMNADVGRQVCNRKMREPAGDVLFANFKRSSCKQHQRIKDGAPSDLAVVERVVEMVRSDGVFG